MHESSYAVELGLGQAPLWQHARPVLSRLDIELTERCNNDCIHCCINRAADDRAAKERELAADEIREILQEAVALGCLTVRFTGGEPLLREDFEELYLCARRLGLKVLLFTNATLITRPLAALLARIPPLEKIEVSVYGMTKGSYEAVSRVPGSFEAAWRGIRLLLDHRIPFVVKGALLPPNRDEVGEFEAWAATIPWMDKPPSHAMFFDLRCRRDSESKNRLIRGLRPSAAEGLRALTRGARRARYVAEMRQFAARFMRPPGDKLFSCGSGLGGGCVDACGRFQPCLLLRHPDTVYDLSSGSLEDALTRFFPMIRETQAASLAYLARCARCFLKGLCEQCPAKSWTEHGTLDTPVEYLCEIAHAQARYLGLLADGERAWEVRDWRERISRFAPQEPSGVGREATPRACRV